MKTPSSTLVKTITEPKKRSKGRPFIEIDIELASMLYLGGFSARDIAKEVGVSPRTLLKRLRLAGVPIREKGGITREIFELRSATMDKI